MLRRLILLLLIISPLLVSAHGGVNDDELIIRMNGNGFEPKELTVVLGDKVLFINNDDADRWPASNSHPVHAIYPQFDPEKHIKPGESWTFTFERVGTWGMHDHLFPHFIGKIIVLEDPDNKIVSTTVSTTTVSEKTSFWKNIRKFFQKLFAREENVVKAGVTPQLLAEFKAKNEKEKYAWLEERARLDDPKIAWEYVLAAYSTPEGVVGTAHDMAHLVGQLLFQKYGLDGLATCDPSFAFGCYHGLIEVAFADDDEVEYEKDLIVAQTGCQNLGDDKSPSYWSCIHGIGHGVATYRDFNLNQSLADCTLLSDTVETYCNDGVFMEFSIDAPANVYRSDDPLYPCNAVAKIYERPCARSQIVVMKSRMRLGVREIAAVCEKSNSADITYHCIEALGFSAADNNSNDVSQIMSTCHQIDNKKMSTQCLVAAAGELVFQNTARWRESTQKICLSLSPADRTLCQTRVDNTAHSYGRN